MKTPRRWWSYGFKIVVESDHKPGIIRAIDSTPAPSAVNQPRLRYACYDFERRHTPGFWDEPEG